MANFIIGDLHGCFDELELLLAKSGFNKGVDNLYLTGDLVARGTQSLQCLEFAMKNDFVQFVLGNHDLNLVAVMLGFKTAHAKDNTQEIINHNQHKKIIDYLLSSPFLLKIGGSKSSEIYLTHAGISPEWDFSLASINAKILQQELSGNNGKNIVKNMYNNSPNKWSEALNEEEKLRYSINAFTRMRYVFSDLALDFACKSEPTKKTQDLTPWFETDAIKSLTVRDKIAFGHWASLLGYTTPCNILALDTGCQWGNYLSSYCVENQQIVIQNKL